MSAGWWKFRHDCKIRVSWTGSNLLFQWPIELTDQSAQNNYQNKNRWMNTNNLHSCRPNKMPLFWTHRYFKYKIVYLKHKPNVFFYNNNKKMPNFYMGSTGVSVMRFSAFYLLVSNFFFIQRMWVRNLCLLWENIR